MHLKICILWLGVAVVPQTETLSLNLRLPHISPKTFKLEENPSEASVYKSETSGSSEKFKAIGLESKTRVKRGIGGLYSNGNKPSFQSSPTSIISPLGRPGRMSSNGNKLPFAGKPRDPNFRISDPSQQQSTSSSQVAFATQPSSFYSNEVASRPGTNPLKLVALAATAIGAAAAIRSAQKGNDETNPIQNPPFSKKLLFGEDTRPFLSFNRNLSPTTSNLQVGNFGLSGQTEFGTKPKFGKIQQINTWENDDCYFCTTTKRLGETTNSTKKSPVVQNKFAAKEDITDMFRHLYSANG
ncbi:hypothetical protein Ocin01_16970 [Orchesella cincta]|uniref:Uncharacterized protein n=1 Tax=Orchesella cincta TaxID=48709 RepID=A0A1D2M9U7_ORCCI|nr:hypothetical protein Ocin01_16970 [Orchesella cincta]